MMGAALRFPVTLVMPSNVSPERKRILTAYGANILWTDPADGIDGSIRKARELAANQPDLYWYADQYSNDNNWRAHYRTTANEIWQQTEGRLTHFLAGHGHQRNIRWNHAALERVESRHSMSIARAGFTLSRSGRLETHGRRHRAAHL